MKFWKTIIICCLTLCLLVSLGITTGFAVENQENTEIQSINEDAERLFEIQELREKNSKTYQMSDGTCQYVGYAEDIHYEDIDSNLKEINNAITDKPSKEGYTYSNTANAWHTYFADSLCEKDAVVLEKDGVSMSFNMVGAQIQNKVTKSSALAKSDSIFDEMLADDNRAVIYKDALTSVDIAYTVRTSGLKEDIILRDASAPNVFSFDVTLKGLSVSDKEGIIYFTNSDGLDVFHLAPMYMEDAIGKYSDKVDYTIKEYKDGCRITITADKAFLDAPDTLYPVVIDPSVMVTGSSDTFDTCVDEEYPTSKYYLSENLWTGGETNINTMRTFIKFDLPTNILATDVTRAYLRIKKRAYEVPGIRAYRVKDDWNSADTSWNDQPRYDSGYSSTTAYNDSGDWYRMYTTTLIKWWLNGTYNNYGYCLKEPLESDEDQKTKFYSSDAPSPNKPELIIEYTRKYAYCIGVNHDISGNPGNTGDFTQNVAYADSSYETISTITTSYTKYTPTYQYMRGDNLNGDRRIGSYVVFLNGHAGGLGQYIKFNHDNNYGDYATGVYYGTDSTISGYTYAGIQSTDMSGVDLISFVGCSTGYGTTNLCTRAITAGATSAVGFSASINSRNTYGPEWLEVYNDELASGSTIEDAIDAATEDYPDSNLGDYFVIEGSSSNTIAPSSSKASSTSSKIDKYECDIPFDFSKHLERTSFPLNTAKGFDKMISKIKEVDPSFDGKGYYVWINTNAGNKSGSIKFTYYVENEIQTNKTYLFSVRNGTVTKLLSLNRPLPANKSELEETLIQKIDDFKDSYKPEKVDMSNVVEIRERYLYNYDTSELRYVYSVFREVEGVIVDEVTEITLK